MPWSYDLAIVKIKLLFTQGRLEVSDKSLIDVFQAGGLIAYPTEAVFGVGCDPDSDQALKKLLALKQRPVEKGLILLAGDYQQLLPYVDDKALTSDQRKAILARWYIDRRDERCELPIRFVGRGLRPAANWLAGARFGLPRPPGTRDRLPSSL